MQKDEKGSSIKLTIVGVVILACVAAVAAWRIRPQMEEKRRLEEKRDELAREVAARRAEVEELNSKSLRFETDPDFVEHEARRNHRMFPGETEFVFDAPE